MPPKPVANPTVPSEPSISTQKEPSTLIPQLVLEVLYFSHRDMGVEMGVSISLQRMSAKLAPPRPTDDIPLLPMTTSDIVIVTTRSNAIHHVGTDGLDGGEAASSGGSHNG
jgi:hypothetical protein